MREYQISGRLIDWLNVQQIKTENNETENNKIHW